MQGLTFSNQILFGLVKKTKANIQPLQVNKHVDIKLSAHDSFLKKPSSGDAQSRKVGKQNNLKVLGPSKPNG